VRKTYSAPTPARLPIRKMALWIIERENTTPADVATTAAAKNHQSTSVAN
jgi:hypothetical protein